MQSSWTHLLRALYRKDGSILRFSGPRVLSGKGDVLGSITAKGDRLSPSRTFVAAARRLACAGRGCYPFLLARSMMIDQRMMSQTAFGSVRSFNVSVRLRKILLKRRHDSKGYDKSQSAQPQNGIDCIRVVLGLL